MQTGQAPVASSGAAVQESNPRCRSVAWCVGFRPLVACLGAGSNATLPALATASAARGESCDGALPRRLCVGTKPWISTARPDEFLPYVGATTLLPDFTLRA